MKTNDIKKGTRVQLACGWYGTMYDNMKGNIRMVEVEGYEKEIGSVYSHDIIFAKDTSGKWIEVEHSPAQLKLKAQLTTMDW